MENEQTKKIRANEKTQTILKICGTKKVSFEDLLKEMSIPERGEDNKLSSKAMSFQNYLNRLVEVDILETNWKKGSRLSPPDKFYWKSARLDSDGFIKMNLDTTQSKFHNIIGRILTHMMGYSRNIANAGILIAGDPGGGKTTTMRDLSSITGIPLTVIEAPHVTDENIVNIPFVTISDGKKTENSISIDLKVQKAESALITEIKKIAALKLDDEALEEKIKFLPHCQSYYEYFKPYITEVRKNYDAILFLDEFYRTGDVKIQNMLREILNGRIGENRIPTGTYIIYASNMNDDGLDDIPQNHNNEIVELNAPDMSCFFKYLKAKYFDEPNAVKARLNGHAPSAEEQEIIDRPILLPKVFNVFAKNMKQVHFGANDVDNEIRLSPRRIEQIIMYTNEVIRSIDNGANTKRESTLLMNFIKTNLRNYLTGKYHKHIQDIIDIVSSICPSNVDLGDALAPTQWKEEVEQQILMKEAMGDARRQVIAIAGEPGIAKTLHVKEIAESLGMNLIHIGTQNLLKEDTMGIPIITEEGTVHFSDPNLYSMIMNMYDNPELAVTATGKYKQILFLDELNRSSKDVFNALRRVMLEKDFNEHCKLPSDILIMVALNPHDTGANEFTTHIRDVMDIVEAEPSHREIDRFIKERRMTKEFNKTLGFNCGDVYTKLLEDFLREHSSHTNIAGEKVGVDQRTFYLNLNSTGAPVYLSPREIDYVVMHALSSSVDDLALLKRYDSQEIYTDKEYGEFILVLQNKLSNVFEGVMRSILYKNDQDTNDIVDHIKNFDSYLRSNSEMFYGIKEEKQESIKTLYEAMKEFDFDVSKLEKNHVEDYLLQRCAKSGEFQNNLNKIFDEVGSSKKDKVDKINTCGIIGVRILKILNEITQDGNDLDNKLFDDVVNMTHNIIKEGAIPLDKENGGEEVTKFFTKLQEHPTVNQMLMDFYRLKTGKEPVLNEE
jgi:MoxR-like ATPase